MTIKEHIIVLYQDGLSSDEIADELKIKKSSYFYKVLSDIKCSKKIDTSNIYQSMEDKRCEMTRKEKLMNAILPYKKPEDSKIFHNLEKDITRLRTEINFLEKKISRYDIHLK